MSAQDDDAAKGQGNPPVGEGDPLLGQDPPNLEQLGELNVNASSAGGEQHQPPLDITDTASTAKKTGNATPRKARKRKSERKENTTKKSKEKRPKT